MSRSNSKVVLPFNRELPKDVAALEPHWQDLYVQLPALCGYEILCPALGFKSPKTMSNVFTHDPQAPRPIRLGRTAMVSRGDVVLWAARRAASAGRRGRRPASAKV